MLAEHLAQSGTEVILFSARAPGDSSGRGLDPRVRRHQIPDRKLIALALIAIKRAVRGFLARIRGHDSTSVSSASSQHVPLGDQSLGLVGRVRAHFFRFVGAVDDHKWWSLKLLFSLSSEFFRGRPSVLVVSGPPFSPVVSSSLFSKLTSVATLIDFRDPWSGRSQSIEYLGFRAMLDDNLEALCARGAAAITTTAPTLARDLRMRYSTYGAYICDVLNGFDDEMVIEAVPPSGGLYLLFAGTIYQNRSPMPLLKALARLVEMSGVDRAKIRLAFVGSCSSWRGIDLVDWVRTNNLDDCVSFRAAVPRSEVARLISDCNVLVNLAQGQKRQIPAKLFEHVASRRAVLLFAEPDSDSARVAAGLVGVCRVDDDIDDVTTKLRTLYFEYCDGVAPKQSTAIDPEQALSRRASNERFVRVLQRLQVDAS
jgi:hypothetical protein